jgi:hypothetical protein
VTGGVAWKMWEPQENLTTALSIINSTDVIGLQAKHCLVTCILQGQPLVPKYLQYISPGTKIFIYDWTEFLLTDMLWQPLSWPILNYWTQALHGCTLEYVRKYWCHNAKHFFEEEIGPYYYRALKFTCVCTLYMEKLVGWKNVWNSEKTKISTTEEPEGH